ncbi:MAG: site-2 protease family protein [Bacteroides sp.]|nr:site-2 protease family protein [Eubacterium sp.]MCM1418708.1 site-2 protease family protein [Roseburia sp.]MCM1462736.1 site-2 protease family protein [Bacteroides sp.]
MDIVITILVFFAIIIIHELGHFTAARIFGMTVDEFTIGMGPRLFAKRGKKTLYSFRLLPIGGAVSLGEDLETDDPNAFRNKPVWQRMIVIVAGAIMNLILGLIVCIVSVSLAENIATTRVSAFTADAVSSEKLQLGDRIVEMNGMSIWTTMDISYCLQNSAAKADEGDELLDRADEGDAFLYFDMVVERDGARVALYDVPFVYARASEERSAGIVIDFMVLPEEKNAATVLSAGFRTALTEGRLIWITLLDLVTGTYGINDLSGPIGVVTTMSTAYRVMSLNAFLTLVAFISINIGIFNLLPIPALDGARFLFLLIEAIRRKPLPAEKEGMVHFIGFAALMLLMLIVTFQDLARLFTGGT